MKKIFAIMGMATAAALAFTSCQKEAPETPENIIEEPATGAVPFVIHVNAETKTTNAGMSTVWAANDQLSVFHEDVEDAGTYYPTNATADQFTITEENLSTKTFTGTLGTALQDGKSYNWYAIYPYNVNIKTPANTSAGYLTIGSAANGAQTQTGNNSMGHIAGKNYPLAGKATSVTYGSVPSITMTHVSSLVEITVTNSLAEDLTVTSIDFTSATGDIVGTYYINFAGATPTFTESGPTYVSRTATLNVNSGAAIATSDSAKFYLAVKPFTATAGSNILTVTVHGTTASGSGTQVKEISSGDPVVFHAGKIKKIAVNYNTAMETIINWNLAVNQTSTVTENSISWSSAPVSLAVDKHNATTATNSYYGGDASNHTSTRFYTNSMMTIAPASGKAINKVVFTATSESYASALANSSWTNATAVKDGTTVTVYPGDRTADVTSLIGGACGFTSIQVYWEASGTTSLSSISISGQTTELTKGGSFTFGGTVTAIYSDSSERIVTSCATFTGYDMSTTGAQTVTVHFTDGEEKTITYNITVSDSGKETIYTLEAEQSTVNTGYGSNYDVTINEVAWSVPGNQNFAGFWKFGGKKSKAADPTFEATREIYGGAITGDVDEIVIETNGVDNVNLSVSEITISVFNTKADAQSNTNSIASFTTSDDTTFEVNTPKSLTFTKVGTTDCNGKFYRIAFSVSNTTTTNRGLQFISATFYKNN